MTISLVPNSLARRICSIETGCASAGLPPIRKIAFALWMSLKLLVIAP